VCGDGILEGNEQCDDANEISEDGCENDCTVSVNGSEEFLEPGDHLFTVPPGIFEVRALAIGGGGSGNECGGCNGGGGGGGAKSLVNVQPGQEIFLTVGRGGGNTGTDAPHLDGGDSTIGNPVNITAGGGKTDGPGGVGSGGNLHNSKGGSHGGTIDGHKLDGVPDEAGDAGGSGSGLQGFSSGPPAGTGLGYGGGGGGQNCQNYGGPCDGGAGGVNGYPGGSVGGDGGGPSGGKTGNEIDNQAFCGGHSYYNGGGGGSFGGGGGNDGSGQGSEQCAVGLYLGGDAAHGYVRFEWGDP
jgi:cysteine-rich repeat protein